MESAKLAVKVYGALNVRSVSITDPFCYLPVFVTKRTFLILFLGCSPFPTPERYWMERTRSFLMQSKVLSKESMICSICGMGTLKDALWYFEQFLSSLHPRSWRSIFFIFSKGNIYGQITVRACSGLHGSDGFFQVRCLESLLSWNSLQN